MSILSSVQKIALIPSVVGGNLVTAAAEKITGNKYGRTTTAEFQATKTGQILGTGIAASGVALAIATGGAAAAANAVGRAAIAHPIQTAAGLFVGAPLVTGVLAGEGQSPEKNIGSLSSAAYNTGQGLINVAQEHPVGTAILGSVVGGVAAYEVGKKIFGSDNSGVQSVPVIAGNQAPVQTLEQTQAPLPENATAEGTKTKRKRRKSRLHPRSQTISQRVNVIVNQRNSANRISKRYLNMIPVVR